MIGKIPTGEARVSGPRTPADRALAGAGPEAEEAGRQARGGVQVGLNVQDGLQEACHAERHIHAAHRQGSEPAAAGLRDVHLVGHGPVRRAVVRHVIAPRAEMGQGTHTALAMMLADASGGGELSSDVYEVVSKSLA